LIASLGPWVRLAVRLRDRGLDLRVERAADRIELLVGHALLHEVCTRAIDGIFRHPAADLVLRAVTTVVVV
jgi:hypothetical protein